MKKEPLSKNFIGSCIKLSTMLISDRYYWKLLPHFRLVKSALNQLSNKTRIIFLKAAGIINGTDSRFEIFLKEKLKDTRELFLTT